MYELIQDKHIHDSCFNLTGTRSIRVVGTSILKHQQLRLIPSKQLFSFLQKGQAFLFMTSDIFA
jgi:hypothetical protein